MEDNKNMLVVNMFGNSCSGKSTHATGLFCALKKAGLKVELVREHCKNWFYEDLQYKLSNQMLITGKQIEQTEMFRKGGCEVIVTDSPILLGSLYSQVYNIDINLANAIRTAHHANNNYNILLESDIEFDSHGRGASGINRDVIFNLLMREGLIFDKDYKTTELDSYKLIVNDIKRRLKC